MTRKRNDNHSTEFGLWLREQDRLASIKGYLATNIDFVWTNHKTGKYILIEEKRHCSKLAQWQYEMFKSIDKGLEDDPQYFGFYVLVFEKTCPADGKMWVSRIRTSGTIKTGCGRFWMPFAKRQISESALIEMLRLEWCTEDARLKAMKEVDE